MNGLIDTLFKYEQIKVLSADGVENNLLSNRSSRNNERVKCQRYKSHFI